MSINLDLISYVEHYPIHIVSTVILLALSYFIYNRNHVRINQIITLEEHFMSSAYLAASGNCGPKYQAFKDVNHLGSRRIADLDKHKIHIQVISQAPGPPELFTTEICQQSNDQLYNAIKESRGRFAGFATLPMGDPDAAALELEKAVIDYGFRGAMIGNHHDGSFYDGVKYVPVFEKAVELEVPIYIHPSPPTAEMQRLLYDSDAYSATASFALATSVFGWHEMTGLHILRLITSGLFDRLPTLQIIIGHAGECLPFMFDRIQTRLSPVLSQLDIKRDFKTVMHENILMTTAGFFDLDVLRLMMRTMPIERILFSIDYPYSSNAEGINFLNKIRKSGLMKQDEFELFTYKNAKRILHL